MVRLTDIHSLTDFQRNTKEYLDRLEKTGQPELLTVNGEARVVVQDAKSYQKLLDELEEAQVLDSIRRSMEDVKAGRVYPADQVFAELRQKYEQMKINKSKKAS